MSIETLSHGSPAGNGRNFACGFTFPLWYRAQGSHCFRKASRSEDHDGQYARAWMDGSCSFFAS